MEARRLWQVGIIVLSVMHLFLGKCPGAEKKFPVKPIQVIIPFQPGTTDNILRPFAEKMQEYLGQTVNFVYKPGAAGSVGAGFVAASAPDGYTLVGSSQSSIVGVPLTHGGLTYNWESFAPVCCVAEIPSLFVVKPDAPWKGIKEFIEDAKKNPKKISYSSSGTFGLDHLAFEAFAKEAGIKLNHIPSQGSTPAMTAVLGGHINGASSSLAPALTHIKAGTLRGLVIYTPQRSPALPDVPTIVETGYTLSLTGFYGFLAPRKTPPEVVNAIHLAAKKAVGEHRDSIARRLENLGAQIFFGGPEEYHKKLKDMHAFLKEMIKDLKREELK